MDGNGWTYWKLLEMAGMAGYGFFLNAREWAGMAGDAAIFCKQLEVAGNDWNGCKLMELAKNGLIGWKWLDMT